MDSMKLYFHSLKKMAVQHILKDGGIIFHIIFWDWHTAGSKINGMCSFNCKDTRSCLGGNRVTLEIIRHDGSLHIIIGPSFPEFAIVLNTCRVSFRFLHISSTTEKDLLPCFWWKGWADEGRCVINPPSILQSPHLIRDTLSIYTHHSQAQRRPCQVWNS